jgi:TorA maturation chaperone TorD
MTNFDQNPQESDWGTILTSEMLLLGLLGKLLYQEPEQNWFRSLIEGEVFEEAPLTLHNSDARRGFALLQSWSQGRQCRLGEEGFDLLCSDYTRLFIGPGRVLAPPWESVYFNDERLTFQKQTLQVRGWYRNFGLRAEKIYKEPDDHIGLELAFLSHLAQLGLAALEKQDETEFERLLKAQRHFLEGHPLKWVSLWSQQVEEHAHTDFYCGIALLTKGALLEMASILGLKVSAEV